MIAKNEKDHIQKITGESRPPDLIDYTLWEIIYTDSLTENWTENWTHDTDASIVNSPEGMTVATNKYTDVVWFKYKIPRNFLITFEATSIQTGRSLSSVRVINEVVRNGRTANVLYLHATAVPPYPKNIFEWSGERYDGDAKHYQKNMVNVRISYMSAQQTVRIVQSPKPSPPKLIPAKKVRAALRSVIKPTTELVDENGYLSIANDENIFTPNEPLYYEVQKIGLKLLMRVTNMQTKVAKVFRAELDKDLPEEHGYFAFSLMNRMNTRYKNFRVHNYDKGVYNKTHPTSRA